MPHMEFDLTSVHIVEQASMFLIAILYCNEGISPPLVNNKIQKESQRNQEICERYEAGEGVQDLAKAFGISDKRVYQVLRDTRG
ncbi:MAG: helix-turn-helix domain-containing protein [Anaerolinea sp.]|nr:helix-turn-helix domain-containing protein [Anaerolinea sp.]